MLDADFLEPERLRAFVAVAETGSFSKAARRLRLAQPTVSIQVRRLEETVGRQLLDRKPLFVDLTKDGEAMLGYARELLEVIGRARRQFAQPPLEGSVRLGVFEDFSYTAFADILLGLRRRHSRFELYVESDNSSSLLNQLRNDTLDLIITKRPFGGTEGELLCRQQMVWVGQPGVLEDEGDVVPLALTPPNTVTREIILRVLREAGRRWSVRFESSSVAGLQAAVSAGMGVSAFGVGMIPPDLARLPELVALPPLGEVEFALGLNPGSKDQVVTAFADLLRRVAPIIMARLEEEQTAKLY